jgi:hypothetical protein
MVADQGPSARGWSLTYGLPRGRRTVISILPAAAQLRRGSPEQIFAAALRDWTAPAPS